MSIRCFERVNTHKTIIMQTRTSPEKLNTLLFGGGHNPHGIPSDELLVERAKQGDLDAFDRLALRHQERLYRLGVRILRHEPDAQDVVQISLLSAWKNIGKFESKAQFGSWIYRIATNTALMMLRARRRHPETSPEDMIRVEDSDSLQPVTLLSDGSHQPDVAFQAAELRSHIQAAVDTLSEEARVVFISRDIEDKSTDETAALLELSVSSVKTRLHRARRVLRLTIGAHFDPSC